MLFSVKPTTSKRSHTKGDEPKPAGELCFTGTGNAPRHPNIVGCNKRFLSSVYVLLPLPIGPAAWLPLHIDPPMRASCLVDMAIAGGGEECKVLLDAGADAGFSTETGNPVIERAGAAGHVTVVRLLLEHRADPDASRPDGYIALLWAGEKAHTDVARALLEHRGNPNTAADDNMTPLLWAARDGLTDIARAFLEHGANTNVKSATGVTAGIMAVYCMEGDAREMLLESLVEHNADLHMDTKVGTLANEVPVLLPRLLLLLFLLPPLLLLLVLVVVVVVAVVVLLLLVRILVRLLPLLLLLVVVEVVAVVRSTLPLGGRLRRTRGATGNIYDEVFVG